MLTQVRPDHGAVLNHCLDLLHSLRRELASETPSLLTLDQGALALLIFRNRIERDFPGSESAAAGDTLRTCASSITLYTGGQDGPGSVRWQEAVESIRQAYDRLLYWAREQEVRK